MDCNRYSEISSRYISNLHDSGLRCAESIVCDSMVHQERETHQSSNPINHVRNEQASSIISQLSIEEGLGDIFSQKPKDTHPQNAQKYAKQG